jgi:hypothetical protein
MSFLDWPFERDRSPRESDRRWRRVAVELIELFAAAFPGITYRLVWDSPIINAQAWRLGEARNVYLYGGLVRHPKIGKEGLALSLAHETGHHLGGEPRDPDMTWMTWQGQADYWAARTGMPTVFGASARRFTLRGARQIGALERQLFGGSDEPVSELEPAIRLAILRAALRGEEFPACANDKHALLCILRIPSVGP